MKKFLLTSRWLNLEPVSHLFQRVGTLPDQPGSWEFVQFEFERVPGVGFNLAFTFRATDAPVTVTFAQLWRNRWPSATQ